MESMINQRLPRFPTIFNGSVMRATENCAPNVIKRKKPFYARIAPVLYVEIAQQVIDAPSASQICATFVGRKHVTVVKVGGR
jgi:hypothetical protein